MLQKFVRKILELWAEVIPLRKIVNMIDITIGVSNIETFWGHEMGPSYLPLEMKKRTKKLSKKINLQNIYLSSQFEFKGIPSLWHVFSISVSSRL